MRRTFALIASVVLLAGCGGGSGGDDPAPTPSGNGGGGGGTTTASAGKELFTAKCGSCHVLEDAGTGGSFGPNLDEVQPDQERVLAKIASGGGGMPPGLYEGEEATTVAEYVAESAG